VAAEQGLPAMVDAVRRRWALCLLVALPLALGVAVYARSLPAQYDAETTVAFAPRLGSQVGADVVRVVLPRYVTLLSADATVQQVASDLHVTPDALAGADVSVATDTANLDIVVRGTDPATAAAIANALARTALTASKDDELLQAQQVATALPPHSPSAPPRGLLTLAGLVAGLVAGLGCAFLAERGSPRLRDATDVTSASTLPVLGQIPFSRELKAGRTVEVSDPVVGSAARAVLARAEQAAGTRGARVVAVTSPDSGDGKTTLAVAYAATAARRGRRVVLVDADLGRAGLTDAMGFDRHVGPGLGELLEGSAPLAACLAEGPVDGVTVLTGSVRPEAVDLLTRRLPSLLEELLRGADQVVVDCPPLAEDDGQALLAQLRTVLLVVRSGAPSAALARSSALLEGLGVHALGVVLNNSRSTPAPEPYGRVPLVAEA